MQHVEKLQPIKGMLQVGHVWHAAWFWTPLTEWQAKISLIRKTSSTIFPQVCGSSFAVCPNSASRAQVEVGLSCPTGKQHLILPNSRGHWLVRALVVRTGTSSPSSCQWWPSQLLPLCSSTAYPSRCDCTACVLPWCNHTVTSLPHIFPIRGLWRLLSPRHWPQ